MYLLRGAKGLGEIEQAARGIPTQTCTRNELDTMVPGAVHQGVILEAGPLPVLNASELLRRNFGDDALLVILDGVEDPHNFGAIVRSAAACGAAAVVFGKDRSAPISPASVKSAAGAMEYIDLAQAANIARFVEQLKKKGFWSVALDAAGDKTIWDTDLKGKIAIVVGGEGKGIRRLVRERCDFTARIPLEGPITALNASVSAAIALSCAAL